MDVSAVEAKVTTAPVAMPTPLPDAGSPFTGNLASNQQPRGVP